MSDEKLVAAMNDARLISACDNVLFPSLEHKILMRLEQACARFRGGETDFIADVAYISGLKDIIQELRAKQLKGNKAIQTFSERA